MEIIGQLKEDRQTITILNSEGSFFRDCKERQGISECISCTTKIPLDIGGA